MIYSEIMNLLAFVLLLWGCQQLSLSLAIEFQGMAMAFNIFAK